MMKEKKPESRPLKNIPPWERIIEAPESDIVNDTFNRRLDESKRWRIKEFSLTMLTPEQEDVIRYITSIEIAMSFIEAKEWKLDTNDPYWDYNFSQMNEMRYRLGYVITYLEGKLINKVSAKNPLKGRKK